ncbi:MAG: CcmD family protein [Pseudomonadota bacterium]
METSQWLLYANASVWLGLGAYLFFVARAQQRLERRLRQMEMLQDD